LAVYFLGDFNETFFHIIICSCPSTDLPSSVEKYPKIKYAISDAPHWRQLDICETSFLLLNEGATLAKQLWGSADELKRTVKFIEDVGLNV
jgi:predicted phage-related endonuclease